MRSRSVPVTIPTAHAPEDAGQSRKKTRVGKDGDCELRGQDLRRGVSNKLGAFAQGDRTTFTLDLQHTSLTYSPALHSPKVMWVSASPIPKFISHCIAVHRLSKLPNPKFSLPLTGNPNLVYQPAATTLFPNLILHPLHHSSDSIPLVFLVPLSA
ncbi:hypothetical protein XELAEV_18039835mg [Xenopus laevis]|uniref:Uncharacterized protein n=1 Tax=Xenopus laevis TaxID=8355 RepID=A0A974C8G0_XENLA|nr:hypothetical protein XELAEV_18039835mg [Xenopus laevis]